MAIDVTGATQSLQPLNRQDPRVTDRNPVPPAPAPEAPTAPTTEPDVQVDTRIGRREAANRALVNEASDLSGQLQDNQDLVDRLRSQRDQVASGRDRTLTGDQRQTLDQERDQLSRDTFEALQRIRANALAPPFGNGVYDAGSLPQDGFFVRNPGTTIDNLDSAISALERQNELLDRNLGGVQDRFNRQQDQQLSPGNRPIVDDREAIQTAARLQQQIREQTPFDINGLSEQDRSVVLGALKT